LQQSRFTGAAAEDDGRIVAGAGKQAPANAPPPPDIRVQYRGRFPARNRDSS
jgi:hypothetical protein